LNEVYRSLGEELKPMENLRAQSKLSEEEFDKALEKLEIHGGAHVEFNGEVMRGGPGWKKTYVIQAQYRAEQLEKVLRFTTSCECRMCALVRHFGDEEDADRPCGACDVCDPAGAVLKQFRRATAAEREWVQRIVDDLRPVDYKAAGTLQRSVDPGGKLNRDAFDGLLNAMVRAGLAGMEDAEYEKDGEVRRFRKVRLTAAGLNVRAHTPLALLISDGIANEFAAQGEPRARAAKAKTAKGKNGDRESMAVNLTVEQGTLATRLKEWRTAEAKRLGVPAFIVLHDRALAALAIARPANARQLLEVNGIGPAKVEKFGEAILGVCSAG
jgi:superfamily II DNA helicase RecQ